MTNPVVIVGGGVAGCVAAGSLAELGHDVVLLEAGPGPDRPGGLDSVDHLGSDLATDWWYPDTPRRGRGLGGGSAVNGMVLDAIHPLDIKRWGWEDAEEHQRWVLERWPRSLLEPGPFTRAFGDRVTEGFPTRPSTLTAGWNGWAPLAVAVDKGRRVSAADAFLTDPSIDVRPQHTVVGVHAGQEPSVELSSGESIAASRVLVAAGNHGTPRLLVDSGLLDKSAVLDPLNHASTVLVAELADELRVASEAVAPSSHMLRTVSGLSMNTVDLQMLVLDHTGSGGQGRTHGAVIVSALEPDRQKVLIAGVTQALRWLHTIEGVASVSISDDRSPVQHHCCSLAGVSLEIPGVDVIDASVLPALPHTNPMVSIAIGARRRALQLINRSLD